MAFGIDGVEKQAAFAGTGNAAENDQPVARNVDGDVFEVMRAGTDDTHGLIRFLRFGSFFLENLPARTSVAIFVPGFVVRTDRFLAGHDSFFRAIRLAGIRWF